MCTSSIIKVINSIKKAFGKSECNICLKECKIQHLDQLHVCSECYEKVKALEKTESFKLLKEQKAGGIKDEL
ncbi:MAG: hypothetical protein ACE5EJ_01850 [Nitrosopumilaceae archaeon]